MEHSSGRGRVIDGNLVLEHDVGARGLVAGTHPRLLIGRTDRAAHENALPANQPVSMTSCFPRRGAALSAAAAQRKDNILSVIKKIQAAGVTTLMGIAGALNARGFKAPRGGKWSAKQMSPRMMA
jgi:hypothetical protein